jgi:2'-hydroxyisoflavone reductase
MRLLVLGGTRFIGRHLVEAAQAAGHRVDVFSRGRTPAPAGARQLIGDRDGDLAALDGDRWDVVVDVSGYLPRQVRDSAARLAGRAGRYLFISSCAVYDGNGAAELAEDAPLRELPDPTVEEITGATYGGLKVLCERAAEATFDGAVLSVRPTFVAGPYDTTDRFTSWLRRVRRGGRVAAPYDPTLPLAFADVRDLARFLVRMCEGDDTGAVNVSGPARPTTWGEALDIAREVTGSDATFTWLPAEFLRSRGADRDALPMAVPYPFRGAAPYATTRARELGLTHTDVATTIRDTLTWDDAAGAPTAGLSDVDEADLLRAWDATGAER